MKLKKIPMRIHELRSGMIVAEEIKSGNIVLVSEGVELTDDLIKKLKDRYFEYKIMVYSEDDYEDENTITNKVKTVEEIKRSLDEFSNNVEEIFESMDGRIKVDITEIRNFTNKVEEELNSPSAVIKNIVLYGSDNDCIFKHSVNVAALSSILGKWIGFDEKEIKFLTYAAILHDFGKTKIDKNILYKPGFLTTKEKAIIREHPIISYNFVKEIPYLHNSVAYGILMHHERLDGSGYPLGVKGDKIHPFAKIIAIADIFDAVNSNRAYKKREDPFAALETIQKESLGRLDYEYCKIFIEHIINYYVGENILLDTDKVCKIIQIHVNDLSRPLLLDGGEFIDLRKERYLQIKNLVL